MVVVEEEDTTRELRRLQSTLAGVMKQIKVSTMSGMLLFDVGNWISTLSLFLLGDNSDCRAAPPVGKEDGAPHRGERKTQCGDEPRGEKQPEGLARARPSRVQCAGPRIPEGHPIRAAGDHVQAAMEQVQAAGHCLQATEGCFRAVGAAAESL